MCGFVGVFNYQTQSFVKKDVVVKMNQLITHRGPDDEGYFDDDFLGLGFKRLSVIDVAGGHQPMTSDCGRYTLVFNGEIYNYKTLRKGLEKKGYTFRTNSDSEVVLALVVLEGAGFELKLDGMFAMSVYDSEHKTVTLYRDRLGKKPLFYSLTASGVVFASEIKPILASGLVSFDVNWSVVSDFFSLGYTVSEQTPFEGVKALLGGHKMEFSMSGHRTEKWWSLDVYSEANKPVVQDLKSQVTSLLERSVQKRMVADVDVGIYLSGGLDSSLLAAMVKKQSPLKKLKAYTVGFASESYDEAEQAREIAEHLNLEHRVIKMGPEDFVNNFTDVVYKSDGLIANPAIFANFLLSKESRSEIKVALNGGGGDELFFGYDTYRADKIASYIPKLPSSVVHLLLKGSSWLKSNHKRL